MNSPIELSDSQQWRMLAAVGGFAWLLYLLGPVLAPFLTSALLAYLGDPLVDRLERRGLPRNPINPYQASSTYRAAWQSW